MDSENTKEHKIKIHLKGINQPVIANALGLVEAERYGIKGHEFKYENASNSDPQFANDRNYFFPVDSIAYIEEDFDKKHTEWFKLLFLGV